MDLEIQRDHQRNSSEWQWLRMTVLFSFQMTLQIVNILMTYTLSRTKAWFAKLWTMKKIKYLSNLTLPRLLSPLLIWTIWSPPVWSLAAKSDAALSCGNWVSYRAQQLLPKQDEWCTNCEKPPLDSCIVRNNWIAYHSSANAQKRRIFHPFFCTWK